MAVPSAERVLRQPFHKFGFLTPGLDFVEANHVETVVNHSACHIVATIVPIVCATVVGCLYPDII